MENNIPIICVEDGEIKGKCVDCKHNKEGICLYLTEDINKEVSHCDFYNNKNMKPSEKIKELAKKQNCPTEAAWSFAIMEFLDEREIEIEKAYHKGFYEGTLAMGAKYEDKSPE